MLKPKEVINPFSIDGFLPEWSDIPEEFKYERTCWNRLFSRWFFFGLRDAKFYPKDGIDLNLAMRHIQVCMSSFLPKHEHKEAGCAYLYSLWFDKVEANGEVYE